MRTASAGPVRGTNRLLAMCRLGVVLLLLAGSWESALAQPAAYEAEDVKAAFLYHFATFVLWPDEERTESPFIIAVLDAEEIAAELESYLPGRSIQGRPMRVQRLESLDELEDAAVLFIGPSQNDRLPHLLQQISDRQLLVVTDARDALDLGSMINFRLVDRRVRFEISLPAAERAGLELSSRLLSAAMFVDTTSAIPPPLPDVLAAQAAARPLRAPRVFRPETETDFKG